MIKKYIKKYWPLLAFSLLINIPIVIMGTIRTNKDITLKGDTQNINDMIKVDTEYEEKGSFSSIYVIDFEHSTILQNLICSNIKTADVSDLNENYNNLSDIERFKVGQIQKESSIAKSIILVYSELMKYEVPDINIEYKYKGIEVTYYSKKSSLRIGDRIIKINDISIDEGRNNFQDALHNYLFDDKLDSYTILRDNKEIIFTEEDIDYNNFYAYDMYDINYETISPKISIKSNLVGGPSGGLMQALSIFNKLYKEYDLTKGYKVSGTGTIDLEGNVGKIGGIKQKIYTAFEDNVDIFFCPKDNYEDALEAYNTLKNKEKMALVPVSHYSDAIYLLGYINDKEV